MDGVVIRCGFLFGRGTVGPHGRQVSVVHTRSLAEDEGKVGGLRDFSVGVQGEIGLYVFFPLSCIGSVV